MKTLRSFIIITVLLVSFFFLPSCLEDDDSPDKFWLEVVTLNPYEENSYYLTTDDGKTLLPVTAYYFKPKKEQRALVNYTKLSDIANGFDHMIKINSIDTILTKPIAENLGIENDNVYGKDPVVIEDIWVGDGYLNIYFGAYFGPDKKAHFVNVLHDDSNENSYVVEFRHNARNDQKDALIYSVIAFDLSDLPDTNNQTVTLLVKVNTFDGDKIYELKYNTNKKEYGIPDSLNDNF